MTVHQHPGRNRANTLTQGQTDVLITIERTGAGLSMFAIFLTILSYIYFKKLRTTPNLFILFASIANAGASVASMIGHDGLQRGENSTLCQVQGFIFEWFMQSDPWWSCAMSINVYLVFFHNANPSDFRKYLWVYCIICFGGPSIPAIVLISIRGDPRGPVFGDAALWCWIGPDWSILQLYSYYIPIWVCIFVSIIIYVAVGYRVFHHRNQLRNIGMPTSSQDEPLSTASARTDDDVESAEESLTRQHDFYGTAVTEVQVTMDFRGHDDTEMITLPSAAHYHSPIRHEPLWTVRAGIEDVHTGTEPKVHQFEAKCSSDSKPRPKRTMMTRLRAVKSNASLKLKRLDPIKMGYLRTSFIFGFAVLITWIPSSINRLWSLTHNNHISFQWSVASGCVLPLQGVWNAIIFFTTSWGTFVEEVKDCTTRVRGRKNAEFRHTAQLESRLDILSHHRDTIERCRIPSVKFAGTNDNIFDDLELDDRSMSGRTTL